MNRLTKHLAATITGTLAAALVTATSVAAAPDPAGPIPAAAVSCTSPSVWLRLQTSLGERCYTGAGTEVVNLPGVSQEQIVGAHVVCLHASASPPSLGCAIGPRTIRIVPAAYVTEIVMSTLT